MLIRTWALILLCYLAFLEALSFLPAPNRAACLIEPHYGYQTTNQSLPEYCPPFHVGVAFIAEKANLFLEAHDKSVVGGFTIVLAISTIGLWLATNKLWAASEKQFALLAQTATAARDSADAAMSGVGADRAWMIFDKFTIGSVSNGRVNGVPVKEGLVIMMDWKNMGRSPAISADIFVDHRIVDWADVQVPMFDPRWGESVSSAPVGPSAVVGGVPLGFDDGTRAAIFARTKAVIFFSAVRYRDIFQPQITRTSELCMKIRFNGYRQEAENKSVPMWDMGLLGTQNTAS